MFVRAYLRASTSEQDASRARDALEQFADSHGQRIASYYIENESGTTLTRPELFRLINDCQPGDVLLTEQVDRLSRLTQRDWEKLRAIIKAKDINIVALDLPTSHQFIKAAASHDDFTGRMLAAVNDMLLDMLAAVARKDYEDRRRRQAEGIKKAKEEGRYKGRPVNQELHKKIRELLAANFGIRKIASPNWADCSTTTVLKIRDQMIEEGLLPAR